MSKLLTKEFWLQALERAIKTFCQTMIAWIGVSAVVLSDVNWEMALSASALATLLSVLTSIVTIKGGDENV